MVFHIVYLLKRIFTALILVLLIVLQSAGQVLCCLGTSKAGVGFGTGSATVAYPVDAKVAAAFDEASKKHLSEYVFGKDVNHQMVKDGYAWHYKLYYKTPSYAEAEDVRGKKQELWQAPNPVEPFQYRKMKKGTK